MILELDGGSIANEEEGPGVELKMVSNLWCSEDVDEVVDKPSNCASFCKYLKDVVSVCTRRRGR